MQEIIKRIDDEVAQLSPPMDDHDAGTIKGLQLARDIITNGDQLQWEDIYGDTEYTEFRMKSYIDDDLSV